MVSARTAGKRGRLPVKPEGERFAIAYVHQYLAHPLPAPAYPVDVTGGIPDDGWGMDANGPDPACTTHPDGVGDCSFAGRQHNRAAKAAAGHEAMPAETSDELVAEYFAYTGGQDTGANLADLLLFWYRRGTVLAFAPVDHTDPAAVDAAVQAFHGVYAGVSLTDNADDLFQQGEPWTLAGSAQPDPSEGHCIVKIAADGKGCDGWVTWGARQDSDEAWTAACLDEAWVIITQEDADAASLDIAALRADIGALHGTGGSGRHAAPDPEPTPAPDHAGLLAEVAGMLREVAAGAGRELHEVISLLNSHGF